MSNEVKDWQRAVGEAIIDMIPDALEQAWEDGLFDQPVTVKVVVEPHTEAEECHT